MLAPQYLKVLRGGCDDMRPRRARPMTKFLQIFSYFIHTRAHITPPRARARAYILNIKIPVNMKLISVFDLKREIAASLEFHFVSRGCSLKSVEYNVEYRR